MVTTWGINYCNQAFGQLSVICQMISDDIPRYQLYNKKERKKIMKEEKEERENNESKRKKEKHKIRTILAFYQTKGRVQVEDYYLT